MTRRRPIPARTRDDVCTECGPDCDCRPWEPNPHAGTWDDALVVRIKTPATTSTGATS